MGSISEIRGDILYGWSLSENSNYRQESLLEVYFQKFVDNAQQCFALLPQVNFPVNNLNFTEGIESKLSS